MAMNSILSPARGEPPRGDSPPDDPVAGDSFPDDSLEEIMRAALAARGQVPDSAADMPAADDPFAAAFAAPGGADRYAIHLPRGMSRDAELEAEARQWFHEAGLPQGIVNGIVREYCRCLGQAPAADDEAGARAELAREWGPDYARRIDQARGIIARCRDAARIADLLAETGLGNNPWLIRSLAALADMPHPGGRS